MRLRSILQGGFLAGFDNCVNFLYNNNYWLIKVVEIKLGNAFRSF